MTAVPKSLYSTWLGTGNGVRLNFRVDDLETVMATWESVKVFRADAEDGTPVAIGSPVTLVAGTQEYNYTDATGDETKWYWIAFYESVGPTDGDKTDPVCGSGGGRYASVEDIRDAGWTVSLASNDEVRRAIINTERYLERLTGNVFLPQQRTFRVDPFTVDAEILPLQTPIIQIDTITLIGELGDEYTEIDEISVENVRVYNRHLTQGLLNPDDRDAPRLVMLRGYWDYAPVSRSLRGRWGKEPQSIKLEGWFGYTELGVDEVPGETEEGSQIPISMGDTPHLITRAVELLLPRFLASPADVDEMDDATRSWQVQKYKARDQEIVYATNSITAGELTGDSVVDEFLSHFIEPTPNVAFV